MVEERGVEGEDKLEMLVSKETNIRSIFIKN